MFLMYLTPYRSYTTTEIVGFVLVEDDPGAGTFAVNDAVAASAMLGTLKASSTAPKNVPSTARRNGTLLLPILAPNPRAE